MMPTDIDAQIFASQMGRCIQQMHSGDNIDARAMEAIEVDRELAHRVGDRETLTPARRVSVFGDSGLRECIEQENGETLL